MRNNAPDKWFMPRRQFLRRVLAHGHLGLVLVRGRAADGTVPRALPTSRGGAVAGEPTAARVGQQILDNGGNAVDAAVAAALAAGVVSVHNCGLGGYGGHMVMALQGGRKITAIDFNSTAPLAMRPDIFAPDKSGNVPDRRNENGWLAAGVPGTVAGLDLALKRYGTLKFGQAAAPAIDLADNGFALGQGVAGSIRRTVAFLKQDPASTRLLLRDGEPLKAGEHFRNPALAELLRTLSAGDATLEFYRGTVAAVIADAFTRQGGLVTREDMAAYRAREVEPLALAWGDSKIFTAPLTAGGLTVLETLAILKALGWHQMPPGIQKTLLRLEAQRQAWQDRLTLLGDPEKVSVPVRRLLSGAYAREKAEEVKSRVKRAKPLAFYQEPVGHGGTVHLSTADTAGNMVALTLTHGNSFGARVTVEEFGLLLGHGMSRFDPRPDHPNGPGPRKRPLHNMCPTLVTTKGRVTLALGGAGGRKIPNSVLDVLVHGVLGGLPLLEALAAPRWHTEGDLNLFLESKWPQEEIAALQKSGYIVQAGGGAIVSAVGRNPESGHVIAGGR